MASPADHVDHADPEVVAFLRESELPLLRWPGGNFVSARHTRRHMRKEHYAPRLSDREMRARWAANGSKTAAERAHEVVEEVLGRPATPHLPDAKTRELLERHPALVREQFDPREVGA